MSLVLGKPQPRSERGVAFGMRAPFRDALRITTHCKVDCHVDRSLLEGTYVNEVLDGPY
jgi:hypothetical protein